MATKSTTATESIGHASDPDRIDQKPGLTHTSTNISLSPELFEKLYLAPKVPHAAENVGKFANATPLGFLGFVISTFTFAMVLMGWGGANGLPAVAGIFFFTGPVLLLLSTIFLWIQAQFFPMMVCGLFCVFWLSFGLLQLPTLGLAAAYSPTGDAAAGMVSKGYGDHDTDCKISLGVVASEARHEWQFTEMNAVIALYLLVWGFALGTFWIFTLRINVVFAGIFLFVTVGSWILSGAYWALSDGKFDKALKLQKAGGALLFVVGLLGWYMLFVIMAAEMRWSMCPPVGDLSHYWSKTDVELAVLENEKKK